MTTPRSEASHQPWVPVVSVTGQPLMPCRPVRARKLVEQGRAIKKWRNRFFYIQMLNLTEEKTQPVTVGVDPGSKMEGYTVKAFHKTFLNIQSYARNGKAIQRALKLRSVLRRSRRNRKTPYRQPRWFNRTRPDDWLPPSTKARWQLKLNITKHLIRLYPITRIIIEDIQFITKAGEKHWNSNFSPIQTGKNWFYNQLEALNLNVIKVSGMTTFQLRQSAGLYKTPNKLSTSFDAHCVDSWVLANSDVGGHIQPDQKEVLVLHPLTYSRRQLHRCNPSTGGHRSRYGGTMSLGFKRGMLVVHPKYGKSLIGGYGSDGRFSLHAVLSGLRLTHNVKLNDFIAISYSPWRITGYASIPLSVQQERRLTRQSRARLRYNIGLSI